MCRILDKMKGVFICDLTKGLQITRLACDMNRNDCSSLGCAPSNDVCWADIESASNTIAKYWTGPEICHDFARCSKGVCRYHHFVSSPKPDGTESKVQSTDTGA